MSEYGAIERAVDVLKDVVTTMIGLAGIVIGQDMIFRAGGGEGVVPRRRRVAVLELLRPAEAAARRLIITAARGLTVTLPPSRAPKKPTDVRSSITMHGGVRTRMVWQPGAQFPQMIPLPERKPPTKMPFALLDPLLIPFRRRRRYVKAHQAPRITSLAPGAPRPVPLPPPPAPGDLLDDKRLCMRVAALHGALADIPAQARRFALWQARTERFNARLPATARRRRTWPFRMGRLPGCRPLKWDSEGYHLVQPGPRNRRGKPARPVDHVLVKAHYMAFDALNNPRRDSS